MNIFWKYLCSFAGVVCIAICGAAAAQAAPQGQWVLPAVPLSEANTGNSEPRVVTAPDDTTTAVWRHYDGANYIIQARTRPPGGKFGSVVNLSAPGQDASSPEIAVGPDNVTTAIWRRYDGANYIIQARTRPPGGEFGAAVELSVPGKSASDPQLATSPDGTTTAIWGRFDGNTWVLQSRTRPPGGIFGATTDLSDGSGFTSNYQIATDSNGTTTVMWMQFSENNFFIQSRTRPAGGVFGVTENLSEPAGNEERRPHLTSAPDGTTTVMWEQFNGAHFVIQSRTRPFGGMFGVTENLSDPDQNASFPRLTTAPDGTTTAAWEIEDGVDSRIQTRTRPPGKLFEAAVDLTASGHALRPNIGTSPDGTTTVIWTRDIGDVNVIESRTRPPGGNFGVTTVLSDASEQSFSNPQITLNSDGAATAVWNSSGSKPIIRSASTGNQYELKVDVLGAGSVSSNPAGVGCQGFCSSTFSFEAGSEVTLTAAPAPGEHTFQFWGGACAKYGNNSECVVTMDTAKEVSATFISTDPPPTCETDPNFCKPEPTCPTDPEKCALPPLKKATNHIAVFDGKRLHIRLKCPARFKPKCLTTSTPVTLRNRKGKPMAAKQVKTKISSSKWKNTTYLIKPAYRKTLEAMTLIDRKLLVTKQQIRSKRIGKAKARPNRKSSTVFHTYKVRIKG